MFKIKLRFKKDSFLPDFARHVDSKIFDNILIVRKESKVSYADKMKVEFWFYEFKLKKWKYLSKMIQGSDCKSFEDIYHTWRRIQHFKEKYGNKKV